MKKVYLVFILSFIIENVFCQFERMPLNYPHDGTIHIPEMLSIVDANSLWVGTWKVNLSSLSPYSEAIKSTDGGQTWQFYHIPITGSPYISDVEALDVNTCYYVFLNPSAGGGQIWKTTDGGTTWTRKTTTQFTGGAPDFLHIFSQDTIISIGDPTSGYFEVQLSNDGGNTWTRVPQTDLPSILDPLEMGSAGKSFGAIGSTLWFGTSRGRCFKTVDQGNHWSVSVISSDPNFHNWYMCFSDNLHGIAYTISPPPPFYYLTNDGGNTWIPISLLPGSIYPGICPVYGIYGGYILAAEDSGLFKTSVYYTNDFFSNLTKIDSGLYTYNNYIYFKDATTGWLPGAYVNDSTILKFTDVLTSVNDKMPSSESLRIVPNPSNQFALVTFPADIVGHIKTVQILDFSGRMIQDFSIGRNETLLRINSSSYTNGVYNIEVITDNGLQKNTRWVICH